MDKGPENCISEKNSKCGECLCVNDGADGFGKSDCNCIVPPWKLRVVSMGQHSKTESITIPDDADTHIRTNRAEVKFVSSWRQNYCV